MTLITLIYFELFRGTYPGLPDGRVGGGNPLEGAPTLNFAKFVK